MTSLPLEEDSDRLAKKIIANPEIGWRDGGRDSYTAPPGSPNSRGSRDDSRIFRRKNMLVLAPCFLMAAATTGQSGLSLNPNGPPGTGTGATQSRFGTANCNVIDFEGVGDQVPIGTISG